MAKTVSPTSSRKTPSNQMGQPRPKLWIVSGPGVPVESLRSSLAPSFDVSVVDPGPLADASGAAALVLTSQGDLRKLTAAPEGVSALLDAMGQGVCLVRASGEVVWSNTKFARFDGKVQSQIAAACLGALTSLRQRSTRAMVPGQGGEAIARLEVETPDSRIYEVIVSPADGDAAQMAAAIVRDITTERRLRRKLDAIDQAGYQLVRFEAESVRKANVFERLRLLETRILHSCRDLLKFNHFAIRLLDERSGRLEMVMHSGLPQEAVELEIYPLEEGNGISGYVAATGRSYICSDTEKDKLFLPGVVNARSSLTVPLRLHDKVIGVFDVESQNVGAFTEDDRQFAEIFGRYIAMALHMLNLLVVERSAVNETVTGRVEGELSEPLMDILKEADWLKQIAARDPEAARHLDRITADVEAIRRRVKNVASGPQTLLGVEGAMAEIKKDPALEGKRILVADDEANVRRIIHDVLHNRGCEVDVFESGVGAITALEEARDGKRPRFDVVLSDIRMPDRNGYDVFKAAREALPGVPVILMTGFGYDPHHSIVRASQAGLQNVLFKPFPVERLLEEVRKAVTAPS
ncbi:MAG: response regulator [Phycisphaeraceae bacterium]|nr:response regulator [Phycisphaeraceae bacterium]